MLHCVITLDKEQLFSPSYFVLCVFFCILSHDFLCFFFLFFFSFPVHTYSSSSFTHISVNRRSIHSNNYSLINQSQLYFSSISSVCLIYNIFSPYKLLSKINVQGNFWYKILSAVQPSGMLSIYGTIPTTLILSPQLGLFLLPFFLC